MTNKPKKSCSAALAIGEMQIKPTMRLLHSQWMTIIKRTDCIKSWWRGRGNRNPHILLVGLKNCAVAVENSLAVFQKV